MTVSSRRESATNFSGAASWQRSSYQGDIITAIAVGQPSRLPRPRRRPSFGRFVSEPAEIQGPLRKRYLGLQPGTVFASRGPDTGPRPRRSRAWPLPFSQAKASPYRENGVSENAAARVVLRCPGLRGGGGGAALPGNAGRRRHEHGRHIHAHGGVQSLAGA
jgi:hypothetical protein